MKGIFIKKARHIKPGKAKYDGLKLTVHDAFTARVGIEPTHFRLTVERSTIVPPSNINQVDLLILSSNL